MDELWTILVHYGEIGLKGKNKFQFEDRLEKNIRIQCARFNIDLDSVKRPRDRLELHIKQTSSKEDIIKVLKRIPGIKYFTFATIIKKDMEVLKNEVSNYLETFTEPTLAFKTKRGDKSFVLTSPEVNAELGALASEKGIKIDYKGANTTIFTQITHNKMYVYYEKIKGMEGLPIGTVGKVLCLLSGGIDSPVAAYQLMRRGCCVDFLHIHSLATNEIAFKSKMGKLAEYLTSFQNTSKLYVIPSVFYEMISGGKIGDNYEVIVFKHYVLHLAAKLAQKEGYQAIVTGDNLAQVASQTMENLQVTAQDVPIQIFRPLLAYDKEEIVNFSKKIGTFELSIEPYKDCCSLIAKNPITKAKKEKLDYFLNKVDEEELYKVSFEKMESKSYK